MTRTKIIEIAGTHIHQELGELAELHGFRLVALQVSEWASTSLSYGDQRLEPVRWLVVYEIEATR